MPKTPNLKQLREEACLTQRDLAQMAGVHYVTIHRIEAGVSVPTATTVRKLAAALKVRPIALTGRKEKVLA